MSQNQLGISAKVDQMRGRVSKVEYNALSVRLELQADCFAGYGPTTPRRPGRSWSRAMWKKP